MRRVLAEAEAAGALAVLNREWRGTWRLAGRLGGGRKTGAWMVEDADGARAVLKWHASAAERQHVDDMAALVARARDRGWPTPAWLAWALDGWRRPCVLTELIEGAVLERMDDGALDALLGVVERQRGVAGSHGIDWATYAWRSVFEDGSRWRAALRRHSPAAFEAGEAIARRVARYRGVRLPDTDLVHMDFGLHNVLFRNSQVAAVVDLEGIGRGAAAIDLATLLFSAHGADAATEPVLARLVAHAVDRDGVPVLAVSLACALFDWCVFATAGWRPDAIESYLTRAASLFDRFA